MTPGKIFAKLEDSPQHGGQRIVFFTHVPKVLTIDEAKELALTLAKLIDAGEGK